MRTFALLLASSLPLLAQDPAPPAADAALPTAGSPAATQLVEKAIAKMLAFDRGTFKTTEAQDMAVLRDAGFPFEDIEVEGGWSHDLVWGNVDGDRYVRSGGRMVAQVGKEWKLRGSKIASGKPAPFTLDPSLLFTILRDLPAEARRVVNVEGAEIAGKKVVILTLALEDATATEFVDSGAVPGIGSGMMMLGGLGGMVMPELEHTAHLALFVDVEGGDMLRFAARVYEKNPMAGNVRIQVSGQGGDEDEGEAEESAAGKDAKKEPATAAATPAFKKGLPVRKPAKDETVMTFRADFQKLGLAEPPALDDKTKALLRLR